jgi:hypothetical protein
MLALDGRRAKAGGLWLLAAVDVNPVRTPPRPGANLRYPSAGPGR